MAPGTSNKRSAPSSQPTPAPLSKRHHPHADDDEAASASAAAANRHLLDSGIWREAPVLTGTTRFAPLPDCKNILVTGGAGFMFVVPFLCMDGPALTRPPARPSAHAGLSATSR